MGGFASSAFSLMLAWVRSAAAWLWQLAAGGESGGLGVWLAEHWKAVAIALCVIGVAVDWIVYLLRWKPYRVWQSFFRRLRGEAEESAGTVRREPDNVTEQPAEAAEWTPEEPRYEQLAPMMSDDALMTEDTVELTPAPRRRRRRA